MNRILKRIIPLRLKHTIKLGKRYFEYKKRIDNIGKRELVNILLGTPLHKNLGDHLIALAEIDYLNDKGVKNLIEIPMSAFWVFNNELKNQKNHIAKVFISGGGWMGNLWLEDEKAMMEMIDLFKDKSVVVFPQTIFWDYEKANYTKIQLEELSVINNVKDLVFCAREERTFDYIRRNFKKSRNLLVPDMALLYNYHSEGESNEHLKTIGMCIRNDIEKNDYINLDFNDCIKKISDFGYKVISLDTMAHVNINEDDRRRVVDSRIADFSRCDCVLTDRLHGMIMSLLSGTPCVALDNVTHKISGVYKVWIKDCKTVEMVEDMEIDADKLCNIIIKQLDRKMKWKVESVDGLKMLAEEVMWIKSKD